MELKMFHRPKPKKFNYKPVYSDLEKEEKQKKMEELGELKFKLRNERSKKMDNSNSRKGINVAMYLIIIALLLYYIFF